MALLLACTGSQPPAGVEVAVAADVPHLEERALLLLLVDQQLYDPFTVNRVRELGPEMRVELARSLARTGDFGARPSLEALALDEDLEVRREAVFGLGVLGDAEAIPLLVRLAMDVDRETGRLAVEALAKLEAPIGRVTQGVRSLPPEELWGRLAPALFRFPPEAALPTVKRALIEGGTAVYSLAMYALARNPQPSSLPILRELLADPDPWLRSLAARAVGQVGDRSDLSRLWPLLGDSELGPVIQALRSARRLVAGGVTAPPAEWGPRLRELMLDPRRHVRLSAIETSGAWLKDEELGQALLERYETATGRERELVLLALAAARHPRAAELVGQAGNAPETALRQRSAAAAGLLAELPILRRLAVDAEPAVRAAAATELLRLEGEHDPSLAARALGDPDPVVRASPFDWARDPPVIPVADLLAALGSMGETDVVEAQMAALRAVQARAEAVPED
ncbi:MAG: HEAT repeat domain-containing protein, partial [Acidobacteria bacterium]|nr:HEAT repeat domain-containing protein [Acidobacteriota bacterium]